MQEPSPPSDPKATLLHTSTGEHPVLPEIPGYRLVHKLGQGGMASVFLATQESLDRPVCVKVMDRDALVDETSRQRFENEARTIAKLNHPSIVSIYDVGRTTDGRMYYSMPYLPNGDLAQRHFANDEAGIVDLLRSLLSALGFAHSRGIVHRDVKQENVLFDTGNRPLLADFGIALTKNDDARITTVGFAVGSSGYMAPEQARGDIVDGRADLYSVGVLAYELLTGELPFHSSDAFALALMHAQKDIPRLPPEKRHWQAFIDKAMAKAPAQRYRNADDMLQALDRIGRRSGGHLSGRVQQRFDQATGSAFWKSPLMLGLGGVVLLAGGLYAARNHLPWPGSNDSQTKYVFLGGAQSAHPAVASTATIPAAATSAAAAAATTAAVSAAVKDARTQLDGGNLIEPAGKNAAELAAVAWQLAPKAPDSAKLVADVLSALSAQEVKAIAQRDDPRAISYHQHASLLSDTTLGSDTPEGRSYRKAEAAAVQARVQQDTGATDGGAALTKTQALAKQINVKLASTAVAANSAPAADATSAGAFSPSADAGANSPAIAAALKMLDKAGFIPLHGAIAGHPAAAIAKAEVTRHEYAQFVTATQRPSADCTSHKLFAVFGGKRNWTQPGFSQDDSDPVVCVSWDDANAYANWVSERTGKHFRLPYRAEWKLVVEASRGGGGAAAAANGVPLAALETRFSEWLGECGGGDCQKHDVLGKGWRSRGEEALRPRETASGFDDVGFRLVLVLGRRGLGEADNAAGPNPATAEQGDGTQPRERRGLLGRRRRKD